MVLRENQGAFMRSAVLDYQAGQWTQGASFTPDVVFAFLDPDVARQTNAITDLKARFPDTPVIGCTTGGEIAGGEALLGGGVAACLGFDGVGVQVVSMDVAAASESLETGRALAAQLQGEDLAGVFILSDGARVNGSALVDGFREVLGEGASINGGLAGDADRFGETLVGCDGVLAPGRIVAVGFFGKALRLRTGSFGGWQVFGPMRRITRSDGNTLYELDNRSALELYKRYLGDEAEALPGSALFYPLQVSNPDNPDETVVRTILGIDEATGGMTFAGDMPEGWTAQLMVGEINGLIDGAGQAGVEASGAGPDSFAMLVSCIGRRLLLGQRATEEVQAVVKALGGLPHAGFYSYGEISPNGYQGTCNLHNQTMTVTVFEAV